MNYRELSKSDIREIQDDNRSEMRYRDLKAKGRSVKHYLNQIAASKGDKQLERAATFYSLSKEDGNTALAEAIKREYPEIYASPEEIASDKEEEAKKKAQEEEAKKKAQEEAEAKKPLNILRKNMEVTKKSPCYGLSDAEVSNLADRLYDELVPSVGPAKTVAGEILRAYNDLIYRYLNDGDWVERGVFLFGSHYESVFSPRQVSNLKYLTSHYAAQISYFLDVYGDDKRKFFAATERMLLNQIVKHNLDKEPNYTDSRTYWKPSGRKR